MGGNFEQVEHVFNTLPPSGFKEITAVRITERVETPEESVQEEEDDSENSPITFPAQPLHQGKINLDSRLDEDFSPDLIKSLSTFTAEEQETMVLCAWAIIVSSFTGSPKVMFGVTSGPNGPVSRLTLTTEGPLSDLSQNVQTERNQESAGRNPPYLGTLWLIGDASMASVLNQVESAVVLSLLPMESDGGNASGKITAHYDAFIIQSWLLKRVLSCLLWNLARVTTRSDAAQLDVSALTRTLSPADAEVLLSVNYETRPAIGTLHGLFYERARLQPSADAICMIDDDTNTDISWSYAKLAHLAKFLARRLIDEFGLRPGQLVPLVMDRSPQALVAMLAVTTAGGAFVPIDPAQPSFRQQKILQQLEPLQLILTNKVGFSYEEVPILTMATAQHDNIASTTMNGSLLFSPPTGAERDGNQDPESLAYIYFTSGSTGEPKGVMMAHGAFCASAGGLVDGFKLDSTTRMLHFGSLSFDMSLSETFVTLYAGGCICIPGENERLGNLAKAMVRMDVNSAHLTPSMGRMLDPLDVPKLKNLVFGGEPLLRSDVERWRRVGSVELLFNAYGPTESVIAIAAQEINQSYDDTRCVGRRDGIPLWIVHAHDSDTLMPVGAVGEIVIGGHSLARGYLGDKAKTSAAFIADPAWLSGLTKDAGLQASSGRRFYKTGDLGWLDESGRLFVAGRKEAEAQVKINGQRIELGEVSSALTQCLSDGQQGVVALVAIEALDDTKMLTAFVARNSSINADGPAKSNTTVLRAMTADESARLRRLLEDRLTRAMIPSVWLELDRMPTTTSGKTDIKLLKEMATSISDEDLFLADDPAPREEEPCSATEEMLRAVWAAELKLPQVKIRLNHNFFSLGGDSMAAMRMVAELRRHRGMSLTVANVFEKPLLKDMAACMISCATESKGDQQSHGPAPFSMLPGGSEQAKAQQAEIAALCGLADANLIQDAYPCTPMQASLLSITIRNPGAYTVQRILCLDKTVDVAQFQAAWEQVVNNNDILRTRIIFLHEAFQQVVINSPPTWTYLHTEQELQDYITTDQNSPMNLGKPLVRTALYQPRIRYPDSESNRNEPTRFILTIHHSLYDGWTFALLDRRLESAYSSSPLHIHQPSDLSYNRIVADQLTRSSSSAGEAYWAAYLRQADGSEIFPSVPERVQVKEDSTLMRSWTLAALNNGGLAQTQATVFKAAWALVSSQYSGTEFSLFGNVVAGRSHGSSSVGETMGPCFTTVPARLNCRSEQSIRAFLEGVKRDELQSEEWEQMGLARISGIDESTRCVKGLQTFVVVQPAEYVVPTGNELGLWENGAGNWTLDISALMLDFRQKLGEVECVAAFDSRLVSREIVANMLAQVELVSTQLATLDGDTMLGDVEVLTPADLEQLWAWNGPVAPVRVGDEAVTINGSLTQHLLADAEAPAVAAWDKTMSRAMLDDLSSRLATYMINRGCRSGSLVPLYFDHSAFVSVAMLAVLKAGATFVPMDPSQPPARRAAILDQIQPGLLLCSEWYSQTAFGNNWRVVPVGETTIPAADPPRSSEAVPHIGAESPAWVIFTSGSTGQPKGAMLTHGGIVSSFRTFGAAYAFSPNTRILQFSSYAFDACVFEVFATLMHGGCVCIPSTTTRLSMAHLPLFCEARGVNTMLLTPTVARLFAAVIEAGENVFPGLHTIAFTGEALIRGDLRWADRVERVYNTYGPAECSNMCTVKRIERGSSGRKDANPNDIGRIEGVPAWVVDVNDHNRLAPIGAIGELVVEGPTVGTGYLGLPDKTAAAFVAQTKWLARGCPTQAAKWPGRTNRLYRTGDLVRGDVHGGLVYIGRRDTQVKIHGQRVDLGDIESHVMHVSGIVEVVVEFVADTLVAIVKTKSHGEESVRKSQPQLELSPDFEGLSSQLLGLLPSYMVPSVWLKTTVIPKTASDKTDRKLLRNLAAPLLAKAKEPRNTRSKPDVVMSVTNTTERRLQALWAVVLNLPIEVIGRDDNFYALGGDSISAMKLVGMAYRDGLRLDASNVLRQPRLADMAAHAVEESIETVGTLMQVARFSLLPAGTDTTEVRSHIARACGVTEGMVDDVYPATPMQQGLLSLGNESNAYVLQHDLHLDADVDMSRLRAAWQLVSAEHDILRTRLVFHPDLGLVQAVIGGSVELNEIAMGGVDAYLAHDRQRPMSVDEPLSRLAFYDKPGESKRMVWTIHHAIVDGWTLVKLFERLTQLYHSDSQTAEQSAAAMAPQYNSFIRYIQTLDKTRLAAFWRDAVTGHAAMPFPRRPVAVGRETAIDGPVARSGIQKVYNLALPGTLTPATTLPNLITTALAVVTRCHTATDDVIFGLVSSGRHIPVPQVDRIMGPCIATVPFRARPHAQQCIHELLEQVRTWTMDAVAHEQLGLLELSKINDSCAQACQFETLLAIQPEQDRRRDDATTGTTTTETELGFYAAPQLYPSNYALVVEFTPQATTSGSSSFELNLDFDPRIVSEQLAIRLADQLTHVMRQLISADASTLVGDIEILTERDRQLLWAGPNRTLPPACHKDETVHGMIASQCRLRPDAPAVCAWDGDFTYSELDELASHLASRLRTCMGAEAGIVPVCMERSRWMVVAILAVLKAGGTLVMLDHSQPQARLDGILEQIAGASTNGRTKPPLVVTSSTTSCRFARSLSCTPLECQFSTTTTTTTTLDNTPSTGTNPDAWITFTSGSTGTPKGAVLSHSAVCTAFPHIARVLSLTASTRLLQICSPSFDVFTFETFGPLMHGACVCVPSDEMAFAGLPEAVVRMGVDIIVTVPSVVRPFTREEMGNGLRVLGLGGEMLRGDDVRRWAGDGGGDGKGVERVLNMYGPAEASLCVGATVMELCKREESGKEDEYFGAFEMLECCRGWVVDVGDAERLVPVGVVGELLLEGPTLLSRYLGDDKDPRLASAFVVDPSWLVEGCGQGVPGRLGRLYRTGDVVEQTEDGRFLYRGRKDNQVKIRGQRVELSEIETHLQDLVPWATLVAATVFQTDSGVTQLAAFLEPRNDDPRCPTHGSEVDLDGVSASRLPGRALRNDMAARLPVYMVPSISYCISSMPRSTTGKVDRRKVQQLAERLARTADNGTTAEPVRLPVTSLQRNIATLWAETLNITDTAVISLDHTFTELGGDSVIALLLIRAARRKGLPLTGQMMRRDPSLEALAAQLPHENDSTASAASDDVSTKPFSLLPQSLGSSTQLLTNTAQACDVDIAAIEDIYPCTPMQDAIITTSSLEGRSSYTARFILTLPDHISLTRLRAAWESLVASTPILRTRIVQGPESPLQVLLKPAVSRHWVEHTNQLVPFPGFNTPLCQAVLDETGNPGTNNSKRLLLSIHHALYDGETISIIFDRLDEIYKTGQTPSPAPFAPFIHYLATRDVEADRRFWRETMQGLRTKIFPTPPTLLPNKASVDSQDDDTYPERQSSRTMEHTIALRPRTRDNNSNNNNPDIAAHLRAAFALLTSQHTNSTDITFGTVFSNRDLLPVDGIDTLAGPTFSTVPIRIRGIGRGHHGLSQTLGDLIRTVGEAVTAASQHATLGMREIAALSDECKMACAFQTLFIVQPAEEGEGGLVMSGGGLEGARLAVEKFVMGTYALVLECLISGSKVGRRGGGGVTLRATFKEDVVTSDFVRLFLKQLGDLFGRLMDGSREEDVQVLSLYERWIPAVHDCDDSSHGIDSVDVTRVQQPQDLTTVLDMIATQVAQQPQSQAVITPTRDSMSYHQLEKRSSELACQLLEQEHLSSKESRRSATVAILVDEDRHCLMSVVAMLGVLKAGCSFTIVVRGTATDQDDEETQAMIQKVAPALVMNIQRDRDSGGDDGVRNNNNCNTSLIFVPVLGLRLGQDFEIHLELVSGPSGRDLPTEHGKAPTPSSLPRVHSDWPAIKLPIKGTQARTAFEKDNKHVNITHKALATQLSAALNSTTTSRTLLDSSTRMLQASHITCRLSLFEILATLIAGGVVCLPPSPQQRDFSSFAQSITDYILDSEVNTLITPPSMWTEYRDVLAGRIRTVVLVDEWPGDMNLWRHVDNVWVALGSGDDDQGLVSFISLCRAPPKKMRSAISSVAAAAPLPRVLGELPGMTYRVLACGLDSEGDGHDGVVGLMLAPEGVPGELAVSGSAVDHSVLRTGLLVQTWSTPSGCEIRLLGPDVSHYATSVRGASPDLYEIERQTCSILPRGSVVVAEMVRRGERGSEDSKEELALFIWRPDSRATTVGDRTGQDEDVCELDAASSSLAGITAQLSQILTASHVPSVVYTMSRVPRTKAGAVDRLKLRALAQNTAIARASSHEGGPTDTGKSPETELMTEAEYALRKLLGELLAVDETTVGPNTAFEDIGGDSFALIRLIGMARHAGWMLAAKDVVLHKRLRAIAGRMRPIEATTAAAAAAVDATGHTVNGQDRRFSLVPLVDRDALITKAAAVGGVMAGDIEDLLPCTYMQARMAEAGDQVVYDYDMEFDDVLDAERLGAAVDAVVRRHSTLRTVMFPAESHQAANANGWMQAIVRPGVVTQLQSVHPDAIADRQVGHRSGLPRFLWAPSPSGPAGTTPKSRLTIQGLSHAQFDGFSIRALFSDICHIYAGTSSPATAETSCAQFSDYLYNRTAVDRDTEQRRFWAHLLAGSQPTQVPSLVTSNSSSRASPDESLAITLPASLWAKLPSTNQNILAAAWAVTLAAASSPDTDDVTFNQIIANRSGAITASTAASTDGGGGVDTILGACVNMVPMRIHLGGGAADTSPHTTITTVLDLLDTIAAQRAEIVAYEDADIDQVARYCAPDTWRRGAVAAAGVVQTSSRDGDDNNNDNDNGEGHSNNVIIPGTVVVWQDFEQLQNSSSSSTHTVKGHIDPFSTCGSRLEIAGMGLVVRSRPEMSLWAPVSLGVIGRPSADGKDIFLLFAWNKASMSRVAVERIAVGFERVVREFAKDPERMIVGDLLASLRHEVFFD